MAIQIDWGLLGRPADIGGAALTGYNNGRQFAQQRARENALANYAANPTQDALAPIAALDPQAFVSLSRNERENEEVRRTARARAAYSTYVRQNQTGQRPTAAPAAQDGAAAVSGSPVDPATGDILVTGPQTRPVAPEARVSIADVAALDTKLASDLTDHMSKLQENDLKGFEHQMGAGAAIAYIARNLKPDDRRAFLDQQYPALMRAGWTREQLDGFEASDENLDGLISLGAGIEKYMADQRQAAGQAITVRGQDVSAATSRRGQDISAATTRRGQDIGAATARAGQAITMRGQAITMRGQDMQAARAQLTARQKGNVAGKLTDLRAIEQQLNRAEQALNKTGSKGAWAGLVPGRFDSSADAADTALAGLSPLIRKLTRTPGEGSMSDYESRLAQAALPGRGMSDEARAEAFAGLRDLIRTTREGYQELSGGAADGGDRVSNTIRRVR